MTIIDIARMAGVSKSTVSRVISGNGYVSLEKRAKIEQIIEECGYTPSAAARALPSKSSDIIGVIIPGTDSPYYYELLYGISREVETEGLGLLLSNVSDSAKKDLHAIMLMKQHDVRGLIYIPADEYTDSEELDMINSHLAELSFPQLLMERRLEGYEGDAVYTDNFVGARDAVRALIDAGHRKIGIVAGHQRLSVDRLRLEGYKAALREAGIEEEERYIVHTDRDEAACRALVREFLEKGDIPTAFFAAGRYESLGLLKAAHDMCIRIPEDIAYIGFDDVDGLNLFDNKYSHMDRDAHQIGKKAVRMLMERAIGARKRERVVEYIPLTTRLYGSEKLFSS